MNLTIDISKGLYERAKQIAAAENISVEELLTCALEERILRIGFRRVMAKIPAVEPPEYDRL